ncbi:hypothetical protein BC829DRAFT_234186 [Chytridium lagenaria]|nr:hypothetical protein BC829DRAFT_234186 [Chytridium lagenaria]
MADTIIINPYTTITSTTTSAMGDNNNCKNMSLSSTSGSSASSASSASSFSSVSSSSVFSPVMSNGTLTPPLTPPLPTKTMSSLSCHHIHQQPSTFTPLSPAPSTTSSTSTTSSVRRMDSGFLSRNPSAPSAVTEAEPQAPCYSDTHEDMTWDARITDNNERNARKAVRYALRNSRSMDSFHIRSIIGFGSNGVVLSASPLDSQTPTRYGHQDYLPLYQPHCHRTR